MSLVPINATSIAQAVQNDVQNLRQFISWAKVRYESYNLMCSAATMTAAGIAANDQAFILAFIGDLNRIILLSGGTLPTTADDMLYNAAQLLGLS